MKRLKKVFEGWPSVVISGALFVVGLFLIIVALSRVNPLFKAGLLAWVIFP